MSDVRVIARLDIKSENVIKGIHLEGLRVVGKPGELAHKYYSEGVDELLFMDVVASLYERNSILPIVQDAARDIFVPMTVGGGIRTLDDIKAVLRSGADKVAINTAATNRPEFLTEAAETFGSQCIVLSVEAIKRGQGHWEVMTDNGREKTGRNVIEWISEAESRGIGEVLITSVDTEGTENGFDIDLIQSVARATTVPVIACGGAGTADHIAEVIEATKVSALACASILHYNKCDLATIKRRLRDLGCAVRP
ncbi:MAG TPA: imidazole glycerol phosphate synthase subunit HisF [Rhodospirillaceae bacterium]|nr:imidazole glycerol phosphate synthase subunit HisF [Rhodospirillaceae bacterium]|tara:strand:+ start:6603 stop:7361 length:759 start_codon:yes stop_codon:yes gene_type:complete